MPDKPPHLTLLQGGRSRQHHLGDLPVVLAPQAHPPFPVDALIREEDTFLVLDPDIAVRPTSEHPLRTINRAWNQKPLKPGSILVREQPILSYLAVIYDFDSSPPCHELWIAAALTSIVHDAVERQLRSLGVPLPGVRHGGLPIATSLELLREAFATLSCYRPRLWLQVETEDQPAVKSWLDAQ